MQGVYTIADVGLCCVCAAWEMRKDISHAHTYTTKGVIIFTQKKLKSAFLMWFAVLLLDTTREKYDSSGANKISRVLWLSDARFLKQPLRHATLLKLSKKVNIFFSYFIIISLKFHSSFAQGLKSSFFTNISQIFLILFSSILFQISSCFLNF